MVSPGLVNALYAWARGDDERIAQLVAARDALISGVLSDEASATVQSATTNGKSFTKLIGMSKDDKLELFTAVLERLGEITPDPCYSRPDFGDYER